MVRHILFCFFIVPSVASIALPIEAVAMTAYSRKYNLECNKCHDKIPSLNDFGKEFAKNDFELPGVKKVYKTEDDHKDNKKEGKDAKQPKEKQPEGITIKEKANLPEVATKREATDATADANADSAKEERPKRETYKWVAKDGSVYYTDNELRMPVPEGIHGHPVVKKRKHAAASVKKRENVVAQIPRAVVPKGQPASIKPKSKLYGTYEDCMEHELGDASPDSAEEMRSVLQRAEDRCLSYGPTSSKKGNGVSP